jgi:hypothetical protein
MTEQRDVDHLVELAATNISAGVIEEPRVYYDQIELQTNGIISTGDPNVFINGEQFPVRITQIAFGLRGATFDDVFVLPDERLLQRVGVRFVFHDAYYQTATFVEAPLWATKVVTGPAGLSPGQVSYVLDRPVILSARDTLRVTVALETPTDAETTMTASVGFYGTGLQSKRPYFLSSKRELSTIVPQVMQGADFRNDGTEPIALTDMVVRLSSQSDNPVGAGDIRLLRVQVQQIGNGTGAQWFVGPQTPTVVSQCFGGLLGFTQGRMVVHQIPGEGFLWEPGEGITLEAVALDADAEGEILVAACGGFISLV